MAKVNRRYNTDVIMAKTYATLVSDLSNNAGLECKRYTDVQSVVAKCEKSGDYAELRQLCIDMPEPNFNGLPYHFKTQYQIKNFLKRYTFRTDLYSNDTLKSSTNQAFLDLQEELARPRREYRASTNLVLQRARRIVKDVLGQFDAEEHARACRFGTKACVGFPTPASYLHAKAAGPLTGSYGHLRWFANHRTSDKQLDDAFSKEMREIDALALFNVPKSFKTYRGIMPNSLIGSYHSYGLNKMIERRLMKVRINLSKQPNLHQRVAKRESKRRRLVTTDLTNASNCYTSVLVRKLVPYTWYRHLNLGRLSQISIDGCQYYMSSFMGMGIGFTFPLQTLLFYAIIRAVQELHGTKGFISVFGDDLIYHRRIHPAVVKVLNDCGFKINEEKTFVNESFRESCGGDYYRRVDVRPACPQMAGQDLARLPYLAFLHKLANSLTLRWTEHELTSTIHLLKREILRVSEVIHWIPEDLPDYAGVKRISCNWYEQLGPQVWHNKMHCRMFSCLIASPTKVLVPTLIAYYWDSLRVGGNVDHDEDTLPSVWSTVRETIDWVDPKKLGIKQPSNYRSRITRRRLKMLLPCVSEKGGFGLTLRVRQAISILAS